MQIGLIGRFVEGNAPVPIPQLAEVHPLGPRLRQQLVSPFPHFNAQCVEVLVVDDAVSSFLQPTGECPRLTVYAAGHALQPIRSVIDRVHARHHSR